MLGIAEALYPARKPILVRAYENSYDLCSDSTGMPLWWYRGLGVRPIPYAVTAGTLHHFLDLTRRSRSHNLWETGTGGELGWSDFIYHAYIRAAESCASGGREYQHVYVAKIVFAWSYDDGTFVPVTETVRTVVLSEQGDVLDVQGTAGSRRASASPSIAVSDAWTTSSVEDRAAGPGGPPGRR